MGDLIASDEIFFYNYCHNCYNFTFIRKNIIQEIIIPSLFMNPIEWTPSPCNVLNR